MIIIIVLLCLLSWVVVWRLATRNIWTQVNTAISEKSAVQYELARTFGKMTILQEQLLACNQLLAKQREKNHHYRHRMHNLKDKTLR